MNPASSTNRHCGWIGFASLLSALMAGCGNSGSAVELDDRAPRSPIVDATNQTSVEPAAQVTSELPDSTTPMSGAAQAPAADDDEMIIISVADSTGHSTGAAADPARDRSFATEGPDRALRVGFDDLDLMRILRMDPVTPDCDAKMPAWLRGLDGKMVRIRGYMKPHEISTGRTEFVFVRDTGLCCFGPKGKVYDMIYVNLRQGTTTDYIELTPFDVVGTFSIQPMVNEEDSSVFALYFLNDAKIIRR